MRELELLYLWIKLVNIQYARQHLIKQHPNRPYLRREAIGLFATHFRRHVNSRPTTRISELVDFAGIAEINQLNLVCFPRYQNILQLDVSVHYALRMQVHKRLDDLPSVAGCIALCELAFSTDPLEQIAACDVLLHYVDVLLVLVVSDVFHNTRVVECVWHFELEFYVLHLFWLFLESDGVDSLYDDISNWLVFFGASCILLHTLCEVDLALCSLREIRLGDNKFRLVKFELLAVQVEVSGWIGQIEHFLFFTIYSGRLNSNNFHPTSSSSHFLNSLFWYLFLENGSI